MAQNIPQTPLLKLCKKHDPSFTYFTLLPMEVKIEILILAVPNQTVSIRHDNKKWSAKTCPTRRVVVLEVNKNLRAALIGTHFYDVQAPVQIRRTGLHQACVYFNPRIDDILLDLGPSPGSEKLLHWVKKECLPKISRITVRRDHKNAWDKDFYYKEMAYGLESLGKVTKLVFCNVGRGFLYDGIELVDDHPEGRPIKKNGTFLQTKTNLEGGPKLNLEWMDVKSSSETPDFAPGKVLAPKRTMFDYPRYSQFDWINYVGDVWKPAAPDSKGRGPESKGWGQDTECYSGIYLLEMWFDHIKRKNQGWNPPQVFVGFHYPSISATHSSVPVPLPSSFRIKSENGEGNDKENGDRVLCPA